MSPGLKLPRWVSRLAAVSLLAGIITGIYGLVIAPLIVAAGLGAPAAHGDPPDEPPGDVSEIATPVPGEARSPVSP